MSLARARDQRIADQAATGDELRCMARDCPNLWSVDKGDRCCSAHAWAEPHEWPRITQEQQALSAERARAASNRVYKPPRQYTREEKRELLNRLLHAFRKVPA